MARRELDGFLQLIFGRLGGCLGEKIRERVALDCTRDIQLGLLLYMLHNRIEA